MSGSDIKMVGLPAVPASLRGVEAIRPVRPKGGGDVSEADRRKDDGRRAGKGASGKRGGGGRGAGGGIDVLA
ncbi:MAG TPA: hypothetical protein ENJ37_08970 [Deltaproteobacteria bacterium]|nr:hypothetical protein [Deltaproteobacteria bacterium]